MQDAGATKTMFVEGRDGLILDRHTGREMARVPVDKMSISEAQRISRAILAALKAEYALDPRPFGPHLKR
ncbi:hypothetical protein [Paracoccus versutus]|uniref:Uncharacterized protein n=1 Tax=Paracoccus versutus TaxID=34007 RepID=A0A3D9XHK1_PARVE|nr:hypothetical protein [Paracoccus versutus]REF69930.1 hypothetical protein BDD41_2649 [Paracoccus versutus]WGR57720.1 hypothetical protein E3U25_17325 [Paracoccus versutus]